MAVALAQYATDLRVPDDHLQIDSNQDLVATGTTWFGSNSVVNTVGAHVNFAPNMSTTVNGTADTINLRGGYDVVYLTQSGNVVNGFSGGGNNVYGSGETINLAAGFGGGIAGSNDTINMAANTVSAGLLGLNGTFNATGDTITIVNGSSATINGTGDTVNLSGGYDTATLTQSGNIVDAFAGSGYNIYGSGETINLAANAQVSVSGSGDTVAFIGGGAGLAASNLVVRRRPLRYGDRQR
jgi:hypothetical protein